MLFAGVALVLAGMNRFFVGLIFGSWLNGVLTNGIVKYNNEPLTDLLNNDAVSKKDPNNSAPEWSDWWRIMGFILAYKVFVALAKVASNYCSQRHMMISRASATR